MVRTIEGVSGNRQVRLFSLPNFLRVIKIEKMSGWMLIVTISRVNDGDSGGGSGCPFCRTN